MIGAVSSPRRGSVTLVVLCFLAVLSIALASYLAVSNQAMKLSNRSTQTGVSGQLAEMGLERALWAFNHNDWSSWTITGTTATRTVSFPNTKYGKIGLTSSINLRVDNYNAYNAPSVWNATTNYSVNDLVGRGGTWYRSLRSSNLNQAPPNIMYWADTPIPWKWNKSAYSIGDLVNYNGNWYRSKTANTNVIPGTAPAIWQPIPLISFAWDSFTPYNINSIVYYYNFLTGSGTWYQAKTSGLLNILPPLLGLSWQPANISWNWQLASTYAFNDVVYFTGTWYRSKSDGNTGHPPTNTTYWSNAMNLWPWSSGETYHRNDVVYSSGSWYRCLQTNTGQLPPNATYWSNAPALSPAWDGEKSYGIDDIVTYSGTWYRCTAIPLNHDAPPNPLYWASASSVSTSNWDATVTYSAGTLVSYGGVWYRCIAANTKQTPNNAIYWSAVNAPVIYAEGDATLPDATAQTVTTQLRATVTPAPLFPNAASATSTLTFSSGAATGLIDSYNSDLGSYGQVTTPFTAAVPNDTYSAVLAAGTTTGTAVTVTGGTVQGYLAAPSASTPPYAPRYAVGTGVNLKGVAAGSGVDLSRISRSPYIPRFDILSVAARTELVVSGDVTIGTPGATTPTVYYVSTDLDLNGGTTITINGPVILDIQGKLEVRATGKIVITTTGSAEIHFTDRLRMDPSAGSGIANMTNDPKKLILISTANGSNSYIRTKVPFCGVLYMPYENLPIDDNADNVEIFGAVTADVVSFPATPLLHYDTSLRGATFGGTDNPYVLGEWRELVDPAEKVDF